MGFGLWASHAAIIDGPVAGAHQAQDSPRNSLNRRGFLVNGNEQLRRPEADHFEVQRLGFIDINLLKENEGIN